MAIFIGILGVVVAFASGAFAGNFYHLIVHRLPGGGYRVVLPPSCPACGKEERRIWMAPLIWYPILRGKCRCCGHPFNKNVVALEALGGTVAALAFYYYGPTLPFLTTYAFAFAFLLNYVVEFRYRFIVPQLYIPALAAGWVLSWAPGSPSPLSSLAGGVIGGGILLYTLRRGHAETPAWEKALGRQLALTALVGVYLGWESAVFVLAAGGAAAFALPRLARKLFGSNPEGAFGLAVLSASFILTFFNRDVVTWFFRVR